MLHWLLVIILISPVHTDNSQCPESGWVHSSSAEVSCAIDPTVESACLGLQPYLHKCSVLHGFALTFDATNNCCNTMDYFFNM